MQFVIRTLLVVAVIVCAPTFRTDRALAQTPSAEAMFQRLASQSDSIVIGHVLSRSSHPVGPAGQSGIHTLVSVAVDESILGTATSTIDVWIHGGELGTRRRVVTGQASFDVGERILLFVFANSSGHLWPTGMAEGKWRVSRTTADAFEAPVVPAATLSTRTLRALVRSRGAR